MDDFNQNDSGIWLPKDYTVFVKPTEQIISQRKLESLQRLAEIKAWGLRNPTKFMERFLGVELLDVQHYCIMNSWDKQYSLWLATRNMGKALALDTKIPTPNGYKYIEDIHVGDTVFGDDGKPTKVINTSPIFENHDCYNITFDDSTTITADADHLWNVTVNGSSSTIRTEDMFNSIDMTQYCVPMCKPVEYEEKKFDIDPFFIGLLQFKHGLLIPKKYLAGSIQQRRDLLMGVMNEYGRVDKKGRCYFSHKQKTFVLQVVELLNSLGVKCIVKRDCKNYCSVYDTFYTLAFYVDKEHSCFMCQEDTDKLKEELDEDCYLKKIVGIKKVDSVKTKCISVDNESHLFLCGNSYTVTHNSTLLALYYMTRGMLLNNYRAYICAGTSDQSIETFEKIVSIAKNEIESFTGLTDVFLNELVKNNNSDGFIRNPAGFTYKLNNGSFVRTLNSNVNAKRGKRAEAVCFDECGWLNEEVFQVIEPYTAQNKDFKMGGGINVTTLPKELPNQLLYTSSASSVDSYYYKKYREYSKLMMLGSKDHFVADIDCNVMINATAKGKLYPSSLLSQSKVDNAMIENKEKALREYYNQFATDAGMNAIIKRAVIARNTTVRPPIMFNDTKQRKFGLFYDPARSHDNSVVLVVEYVQNEDGEWKGVVANLVNFMEYANKHKRKHMRTPEQVAVLKQMILDYNGKGVDDYENIILYIDAGSGGGGVNIADYFMEDWYEEGHEGDEKYKHRGLIDKTYSSEYASKFPNAVDKLRLMSPTKYKAEMYEAMIKVTGLDLFNFTAEYDNKGYITVVEIDHDFIKKSEEKIRAQITEKYSKDGYSDRKINELIEEKLEEVNAAETKVYKLSPDEEIALSQIDALKEELVNMVRVERSGDKDSFELSKEKQNRLHDDRAYTFAMAGYHLETLRRARITNKKKPSYENIVDDLPIITSKRRIGMFG